jgi:hypothetical protein
MSDTLLPPLPDVITAAGFQPQSPLVIWQNLINAVSATYPGYTTLPGALIDDVVGTMVAACAQCDQARVETVDSLSPYGANPFLLNQIGQMLGIQPGAPSNTSVYVVFNGPAGFVVNKGFTVSDGAYQYTVQDGGAVGASGSSPLLFCVAVQSGTFPAPTGAASIVTSVPTGTTITASFAGGVPGQGAQAEEDYRAQVLQAQLASALGMPRQIKTNLQAVAGVQARLVAVQQVGNGYKILCGGGDPYAVAYAIYLGTFDFSLLVGSDLAVVLVSQATNGVVTTNVEHHLTVGQSITFSGIGGMTQLNGVNATVVSLISNTMFSINTNTSGFSGYTSGGTYTPNGRDVSASLYDAPDTYTIRFVTPPAQVVNIVLLWNTNSTSYVSTTAVQQAAAPALAAYVNGIAVGQPMNLFDIQDAFRAAVAPLLPGPVITRMAFSFVIDGVSVAPSSGTGIISGDSEGYFTTTPSLITVNQG